MKILIVAATAYEISGVIGQLEQKGEKKSFFQYSINGHEVFPIVLGVGSFLTGFGLGKYNLNDIDVAIQIGIAGSFNKNLNIGDVVNVTSDMFGDIGVSNADGSFSSVYDLELWNKDLFPLKDGKITAVNNKLSLNLPSVSGITVNRVTGTENEIEALIHKYPNIDIESMEGAAFMYACTSSNVECVQLRGISNYVEVRNKENWNIDLALNNLESQLMENLLN
jgi:futalosine hydrolase